jgi:chemotaxis-related protein WspB
MDKLTLFLQFEMGEDRFVLDCAQVLEVLPFLALKRIPQALNGIVGIFDYRGVMTPVIDINELIIGISARSCVSTRIIVVSYYDKQGKPHPLGLIAERVTRTFRRGKGDFVDSGVENQASPYLGAVASDSNGLIQYVDAQKLLPTSVCDVLFQKLIEEA